MYPCDCLQKQILWGGRWQDGAAGSSGEDMEQLFSYLSRWGFSTKTMTAASVYIMIILYRYRTCTDFTCTYIDREDVLT